MVTVSIKIYFLIIVYLIFSFGYYRLSMPYADEDKIFVKEFIISLFWPVVVPVLGIYIIYKVLSNNIFREEDID